MLILFISPSSGFLQRRRADCLFDGSAVLVRRGQGHSVGARGGMVAHHDSHGGRVGSGAGVVPLGQP